MQQSKAIKEIIETVISNLEKERDHMQKMINDVEMRIKKNKEAGNVVELSNLTPAEKNEVQKFVQDHIEKEDIPESSDLSNPKFEATSAKKLMPKIKEKV